MNRIIKARSFAAIMLLFMAYSASGQNPGDYRSISSGDWDNPLNWEFFEGEGWVPADDFPNNPDVSVTIMPGHDVVYRESNAQVRDLHVMTGARLYSAGAGSYWYLVTFGNITCDGIIGNLDTVDGFCLKPEGAQCLVSGTGDCRFRRIRKDSGQTPHTVLSIGMDVEVYYDGTGDAIYNNMPGTTLEIEVYPLCGLTLHASLDLQDGILHMLSDSTGNGSLICPDVQHDDSTNVFLDLSIANNYDWHFIGSPVAGQELQPEFVPDPLNNAFDFYKWDEEVAVDSGWINIRNSNGALNTSFETQFVTGRGYLASWSDLFNGNEVRTFSGPVNSGNFSIPVTCSDNQWNLVSNPYPCGLNWQSSGIDKTGLAGLAMYIWDQTINQGLGGYLVAGLFVVPTNSMPPIVPPMNGFFVQALATGSVNITPDSLNTLVHAGMPIYKRSTEEDMCLRMHVSSGEYSDEMVIAIYPGATPGYDPAMDAGKMFRCHDSVPEIAGKTPEGKLLCIDLVGEPPVSVPLYLVSPGTVPLTLTASGAGSFPDETGVFLVDNLLGTRVNMKEEPSYTFTAPPGAIDDRFYVLLDEAVEIRESRSGNEVVQIRSLDKEVIIFNPAGEKGRVTLTDVTGRLIREYPLTGEKVQRIPAPSSSSVMIVTAAWSGGAVSAKLMNMNRN